MMRRLWPLAVLLAFLSHAAIAQTCPTTANSPHFTLGGSVFGYFAAQWNAFFAAKADANNGIICNPTIIGGTQPGAFTISPGNTNTIGTRNNGAQSIAAASILTPQIFPVKKSSSYNVNSDNGGISDSGALLISTGAAAFVLPNPSTGTKGVSYHFGSDGTNGYSLTTVGSTAVIYGCPGANNGITFFNLPVNSYITVVDDGSNYACFYSGLNTGVPYTWTGSQTFNTVYGSINTQSGTTYTLNSGNCGETIKFTNSSSITVTTLNSLPPGCAIGVEQAGSGQVTVVAGSGATQFSAHGFSKTFGQYAIIGLFVDNNSGGSSANYIITGDGA